jgi:CRISPR-associated protein Cmr2
MTTDHLLWHTKLAARLHDPAEKAMVLLRDPAGHENGTSRALTRLLGLHEISTDQIDPDNDEALVRTVFKESISTSVYRHVQRADWWAAAADRPQWPMEEITVTTKKGEEKAFRVAPWAQVRWTNQPVLLHPLTGDTFDLGQRGGLADTDFHDIKARSFDHHASLLGALDDQNPGQPLDHKKALLTLWRFAPELKEGDDNGRLGELWKLLPADTRIPDHSIWDHLDLTSAFAGAFAADPQGEVALLTLAIGPVQPFIASARKMEDLWAGSHLLARLSWEAMRVVAERLGPDAILFPRLRGVPQVDLWLRDECGLPEELFQDCDWMQGSTDSNPLFAAALPNRFVAAVPASQAKELAEAVQTQVRAWLQTLGGNVLARLLEEVGEQNRADLPCHQQMREQLAGFPEVHWAAVPFSLIKVANPDKQTGLDPTQLSAAMQPFFGTADGQDAGFLATPAWQLLQKELAWNEGGKKSTFFAPNPGVLYPAVHDLAERALAAAKALRPFAQSRQEGWRDSLSGEAEWLTTDRTQLGLPPGQRTSTLWARLANARPAWAKQGEHLGALSALKRLWPTLFAEEVGQALGKPDAISRFVVSTRTMALAGNLEKLHDCLKNNESSERLDRFLNTNDKAPALPPKLSKFRDSVAARIPAAQDRLSESRDEQDARTLQRLNSELRDRLGHAPETYYSLLLMDGDRMGAWLAGGDDYAIGYRDSFHPQVQKGFDEHAKGSPDITRYGQQKRALSPGRHLAISGALNDFSLTVVRHVVEREHLGRLIYAGGDDVFAMLPVADLLSTMQRLRHAYSGHDPAHAGGRDPRGLTLHQGFALLNGKLMRMMGTRATASCGAVIAHHQAPLAAVRRELAAAEQRAKNEGGRDAFSITIIKRSGGALRLTAKWGEPKVEVKPVALLGDVRQFLAHQDVSRRAAYHTLEWLDAQTLPTPEGDGAMLQSLLAYQLDRQAQGAAKARAASLAQRLTQLTLAQPAKERITWLRNFISVAEFLAREVRSTAGEDA